MFAVKDTVRAGFTPADMIWHYVNGEYPDWLDGDSGPIGWVKRSHRGIQRLDRVEFPRKQKRYIFSPDFELRFDQAFEEVVRACADPGREGKTWINEQLLEGYCRLHRRGFAHSYEAWQEGRLVGGAFGIHLGSFVSVESMFHRVSNASKAAYGRTLVHLKERGFAFVDVNVVAKHMVNYGEEWVPQWQFEQMQREALRRPLALLDGQAAKRLPWRVRLGLPVARAGSALARRLMRRAALASALSMAQDVLYA